MLIVTGTIAYDYIMDFPGSFGDHILPTQIHKINLSFNVDKFARHRGGTAGNVSYTLSLLKTTHILLSIAGKDFDEYRKVFRKLRIPLDNVVVDKSLYTSTGFAMTDRNDNQIWGYFLGASEKIGSLSLKKIVRKDDLVLIGPSGAKGSMSFAKQCVNLGIPYIFDPGFILTQVNNIDLEFGVNHALYLIGNDYEISLIKNRLKNWRQLFSNKIIITTLGEKGSLIENKGSTYRIKPAKPKKVTDPTGAGDAYRAGFLAGLNRGFDVQISGQMGAVAASFAVEEYGTQEHRFTLNDFRNRYRQTYNSLLKL